MGNASFVGVSKQNGRPRSSSGQTIPYGGPTQAPKGKQGNRKHSQQNQTRNGHLAHPTQPRPVFFPGQDVGFQSSPSPAVSSQRTGNQHPGALPYPTSSSQSAMPMPVPMHIPVPTEPGQPSLVPHQSTFVYQQDAGTGLVIAVPAPMPTELSSSDDSESEIDMTETSESRDRIYMLVLSADEFLGRKFETEARIHTLSVAEERELHMKNIQDLFGLCGHLQDELLRIEQMLAKDDPKLKCLRHFKESYPYVVRALKVLRKNQQLIDEKGVNVDLPTLTTASTETGTGDERSAESTAVQTTGTASVKSEGVQSDGKEVQGTSTQTSAKTGVGSSTETGTSPPTEDELKKQHDEEEKILAAKYAKRLVNKHNVTRDEVNKMLGEHALGMQALRKRQNDERLKWKHLVEAKTQQRLREMRKRKENKDDSDSDEFDVSSALDKRTLPPIKPQTQSRVYHDTVEQIAGESETRSDPPANSSMTRSSHTNGENGDTDESDADTESVESDSYSDDFELLSSDGERVVEEKVTDAMWTRIGLQRRATAEDMQTILQTIKEDELQRSDRHTELCALSPEDTLLLRDVREKDRSAFDSLLRKYRSGEISEQEFSNLLEKHLRNNEHLQQFQKDEKENTEGGDDEMQQKLVQLEETFKKDLLSKKGKLSEEELARMIEEYRQRQLLAIKQRRNEKDRLDDKLKAKLEAKKRRKQEHKQQSVLENNSADDDFWIKLQEKQANGDLTKDEFRELLASYLKREKKQKRKTREQDNSGDKQKASELLEQHEKEAKQIQGLLKAEKDKTDQRLKRRLEAKKKQRRKTPVTDSDDDS